MTNTTRRTYIFVTFNNVDGMLITKLSAGKGTPMQMAKRKFGINVNKTVEVAKRLAELEGTSTFVNQFATLEEAKKYAIETTEYHNEIEYKDMPYGLRLALS